MNGTIKTLFAASVAFGLSLSSISAEEKTREEKVREDRKRVEEAGFWIYNDLPRAFAEAKKSGRPILVVLRCIPCEECVKLDDDLVDQDPVVRPLLDKFVCVRQVSTNGLDLATFQYDTDQSFAVFMLNADGTIYGRFGTRSHRTDWLFDVSLKGLARALEGALELHAQYPANRAALTGKTGPKPLVPSPEKFPALRGKFTDSLNYEGDVVKSCIHCHQIGDAERSYYWNQSKTIPDEVLFPYPHPKSLGLILDPDHRAKVKSVDANSIAATAGFRPGDEIQTLNGQPLLSMADVQWVLHRIPARGGIVSAEIVRGGEPLSIQWKLADGWRLKGDISWRVTSWGLSRMTTGGLRLEPIEKGSRPNGVSRDGMALRVKHAGRYGQHATARRLGFRENDVIVEIDGQTDLHRESDLTRYVLRNSQPGDRLDATVVRNGRRVRLKLPVQK